MLSQRYEADEAHQLGARLVLHPSDKWRLIVQYEYDTETSDPVELGVVVSRDMHDWVAELVFEDDELSDERLVGFRLQPKTRRQLVTGLYYTRDLGANIDARHEESYQHYDY